MHALNPLIGLAHNKGPLREPRHTKGPLSTALG
jgi:hypothetical protein